MSETRYQEGEDLEALLADLDEQHPGKVNVLSVSYPRSGGVMGFFARARVGVEYEVAEGGDPLSDLIDAAEAQDGSSYTPSDPIEDPLATAEGTNAEFARMLLEMAREKAGERALLDVPKEPPTF